jgi:hypothetical protein
MKNRTGPVILAAYTRALFSPKVFSQPDMPSGTGTETMHFIRHTDKPKDRVATYLRIVAAHKPHESEPLRIRFIVGDGRIDCKGKISTPSAGITTAKCLLNSIVSTPAAKLMVAGINSFFLNTPMDRTSTCASQSNTFHSASWSSTNYTIWSTTAMSSSKSAKACTAFLKLASSPMNGSSSTSPNMDMPPPSTSRPFHLYDTTNHILSDC